jgi:hypothetical protein
VPDARWGSIEGPNLFREAQNANLRDLPLGETSFPRPATNYAGSTASRYWLLSPGLPGAFGWGPKGRWFKSSRPDFFLVIMMFRRVERR